jgi:peptide/nickel transport system permease protein
VPEGAKGEGETAMATFLPRTRSVVLYTCVMFRYALRRALWALPTLLSVSIVVFLVTTLLPDPLAQRAGIEPYSVAEDELFEERRARFLDLPLFFNSHPTDIRMLLVDCIPSFGQTTPKAFYCERLLGRLGGAALPLVLPHIDELPAQARRRIAVALTPLARRMDRFRSESFEDPEQATLFWSRFWEDHSIDFTEPSARRAVLRLVEHGGESRERDLYLLDTFALPYLVPALAGSDRRDVSVQIARIISHVTDRNAEIADGAPQSVLRARVSQWRAFWFVHQHDYVVFDGAERLLASVTQTRYAKWMGGALLGDLRSQDGSLSLGDRLKKRALLTLSLVLLAMVLAYGIAIPIGVVSAYRKGKAIDRSFGIALLALYALPSFALAQIFLSLSSGSGHRSSHAALLAVLTLTLGTLTTLSRYQRAAVLDVMRSDYIRAARSRGVFGFRLLVVHALRNAVMSTVALAGIQIPGLIGGAFVVEEVFGLRGLGWETLRAIENHDTPWIVVVTLFTAAIATLTLIASDVVHSLLDPRVRESLRRRMR